MQNSLRIPIVISDGFEILPEMRSSIRRWIREDGWLFINS
jgi:hypothetical protein